MSIEASIDLRIINISTGTIISPLKTFELLIRNEWNAISKDGYSFYKLSNEDDISNWEVSKTSLPELLKILKQKELEKELIGVRILWQDTEIGGEVLLLQEEEMLKQGIHTSMSFLLTSNRKFLIDKDGLKITDVNWYLTKLLPIFNQGDTIVEYFTYEEHI